MIDTNFQTPIAIVKYMVDMIPAFAEKILEPTPGVGNIVNELEERGFEVEAPEDFFLLNHKSKYDCIILNPPFSSKSANMVHAPVDAEIKGMKLGYYILKQCMQMSDNVIALMPWYTISDSDVRMRYIRDFGLKSLTPLPRKTFQYARIQTVIIEMERGYKGDSIFKTNQF